MAARNTISAWLVLAAASLPPIACGGRATRNEQPTASGGAAGNAGQGAAGRGGSGSAGAQRTGHVVLTDEQIVSIENNSCGTFDAEVSAEPCVLELPPAPPGEEFPVEALNLVMYFDNGEAWLILPNERADCHEGWLLLDQSVVLCPGTCTVLHREAGTTIRFTLGCPAGF